MMEEKAGVKQPNSKKDSKRMSMPAAKRMSMPAAKRE